MLSPDDPSIVLVGTEPPMIYISSDGGRTFRAFDSIERFPSRRSWSFFHEPSYAGHILGIAIHPLEPEWIFAGVEDEALIYTL